MEPEQLPLMDAKREEAERVAAEQAGVSIPDGGSVVDGVFGLIDGSLTVIGTVNLISEVAGALPKVAGEGMEVIGNIGEALGDVLDFDF